MAFKSFKTVTVLGIYSGLVLEEGGFGGMHEVMDHFYPGIMTMGAAMMGERGAKEVVRQHPELVKVGLPKGSPYEGKHSKLGWKAWRDKALASLPPTLKLKGPLEVDHTEIRAEIQASSGKRTSRSHRA